MDRCGAKALGAMKGIFNGDTPSKLLAFYTAASNGVFNEGLDHESRIRLEDRGDSQRKHLADLKAAIDLATDGKLGADIIPFEGSFDADAIDGPDILEDLESVPVR